VEHRRRQLSCSNEKPLCPLYPREEPFAASTPFWPRRHFYVRGTEDGKKAAHGPRRSRNGGLIVRGVLFGDSPTNRRAASSNSRVWIFSRARKNLPTQKPVRNRSTDIGANTERNCSVHYVT